MELVLYGRPITKKNSNRILINQRTGKPFISSSKQFKRYEKDCLAQITGKQRLNIADPVNLKVLYYMPTKHRVDLVNLLEATCDILVKARVIKDDDSKIVVGHDGSRVLIDTGNPRAEIFIERV